MIHSDCSLLAHTSWIPVYSFTCVLHFTSQFSRLGPTGHWLPP
jgi:hypothetical protein